MNGLGRILKGLGGTPGAEPVAFFSDIHGNLGAFEAVLADVKSRGPLGLWLGALAVHTCLEVWRVKQHRVTEGRTKERSSSSRPSFSSLPPPHGLGAGPRNARLR